MKTNNQNSKTPFGDALAYLMGIPQAEIVAVYPEMHKNICHRKVRILCSLRSAVLDNFAELEGDICAGIRLSDTQKAGRLWKAALNEGISFDTDDSSLLSTLTEINRVLYACLDEALSLIDWPVDRHYVRQMFIMPGDNTVSGVNTAYCFFARDKSRYPFGKYINWRFDAGNDLSQWLKDDAAFFRGIRTCFSVDGKIDTLKTHIGPAPVVAIVDCENADPSKIYAIFRQIPKCLDELILVDDVNTSTLWGTVGSDIRALGVHVEHIVCDRPKPEKSLVDYVMVSQIMREYYEAQRRSFVLVTSDSDIWAPISSVRDAKFTVLAERIKCCDGLVDILGEHGISVFFAEDFADETLNLADRTIINAVINSAKKWIFNARRAVIEAAKENRISVSRGDITRLAGEALDRLCIVRDAQMQQLRITEAQISAEGEIFPSAKKE